MQTRRPRHSGPTTQPKAASARAAVDEPRSPRWPPRRPHTPRKERSGPLRAGVRRGTAVRAVRRSSQTSLQDYCPQSSGDDHFPDVAAREGQPAGVCLHYYPPPQYMVATPGRGRNRLRLADGDG
ncbi:hypothetical protein MRX96_034469 [Rhipicephalus microplus]